MSLKRTFLWCMIGSVTLAAGLAILALMMDTHTWLVGQILTSSFTFSLFSLSAMGAAYVVERKTWRPAMLLAIPCSVLAVGLWFAVIWEPWGYSYYSSSSIFNSDWQEICVRAGFIASFFAFALPQAGLLSLASFPPGKYVWMQRAAIYTALVMPALLSFAVLVEPNDELSYRVLGVVGILDALGTLAVPVLYRIHGLEKDEGVQSTKLEIRLTCPRCLLEQTLPTGPGRCARCRLKIEVKIEEPRCPKCDYLLHHLTAPVCPECGAALSPEELPAEAPSAIQA
ncbi:MAG: zinc ribbon domain-containing protein [Phycisphaeraceae bacterium]|nr:zinc ribbon domain-containing protein [Phycisphaeraceae bacterium]